MLVAYTKHLRRFVVYVDSYSMSNGRFTQVALLDMLWSFAHASISKLSSTTEGLILTGCKSA